MSIKKERSFTQATRVAWEVTERLKAEGHEAYVVAVDKIGSAPKRRRSRGAASPSKHKAEAAQS